MEGTTVCVLKNKFCNNGWALKIQASCIDNEIHANNFMGNTFDTGTNGALVLNDFSGNYWDRYTGYDLDKNGLGTFPIIRWVCFQLFPKRTRLPCSFRSFMVDLFDRSEKLAPSLTLRILLITPLMRALPLWFMLADFINVSEKLALNVGLELRAGECVAFGPNSCGKPHSLKSIPGYGVCPTKEKLCLTETIYQDVEYRHKSATCHRWTIPG